MTDDTAGTPEPDRRSRAWLLCAICALPHAPADATDTDFDPAADLPWGEDDPNPPVPTGDADEVPVATDPTPYTLGPWERDGRSWVRCWQREGDPVRPVAASVSPSGDEWRVLVLGTPRGTVDLRAPRGVGRERMARAMADTVLGAEWPDLTRTEVPRD